MLYVNEKKEVMMDSILNQKPKLQLVSHPPSFEWDRNSEESCRCFACDRKLNRLKKVRWLEFDQTRNISHDFGHDVFILLDCHNGDSKERLRQEIRALGHPKSSLCWFPFGDDCAKRELKRAREVI